MQCTPWPSQPWSCHSKTSVRNSHESVPYYSSCIKNHHRTDFITRYISFFITYQIYILYSTRDGDLFVPTPTFHITRYILISTWFSSTSFDNSANLLLSNPTCNHQHILSIWYTIACFLNLRPNCLSPAFDTLKPAGLSPEI